MNTQNTKKQLGYTLIELSIGLAITSMVLVGVVAGVQKMMEQVNVNRSVNQIASAVDKIRMIIKRDGDTSFVTLANMTSPTRNAFATSNVTNPGAANAQAFNALGNRMILWTTALGWGVTNQDFRIQLLSVTPNSCIELSAALEGLASAVYVNDGQWQTLKEERNAVVFSASEARRLCPTNRNSELAFEFLK